MIGVGGAGACANKAPAANTRVMVVSVIRRVMMVSTSFLATSYWLLATGYWLLATGYWLLVAVKVWR
jgi:hypothetical protein